MVDIHNYDNKIKNLVIIKKDFIAKKKEIKWWYSRIQTKKTTVNRRITNY